MKPTLWLTSALLLGGLFSTASAIETARIDASSGAPRLVIDGKAVRARIFWGGPGTRRLPIGSEARVVSFDFSPSEDEPGHATMHFRFGQIPGQVDLDDLHVVDLTTGTDVIPACGFEQGEADFNGRWVTYPYGDRNTVATVHVAHDRGRDRSAALSITLKAPASGNWPDFHLYHQPRLALRKGHDYRVTFWARSSTPRDLSVAFYRPGQTFVYLGGPDNGYTDQIRLAAAAGVDLVSFPMDLPWPAPGTAVDWSAVDSSCERILKTNPKALLLPRFGMEPPEWWQKAHPEEMMAWDRRVDAVSAEVASPLYRRDAADRLAALVAHVEGKYGPHMLGYHPCGQNTGEWFYQDTWGPGLNGYSASTQRAFRVWLKTRYPSDDALRTAWHTPQVTLDTATVPSSPDRRRAAAGALRDPAAERAILDFTEFQQQAMADCVCHFAHTVRQATRGRKLVVFFYGYVFEFGAIRNGAATAGHYALRRVLSCPDIDVLCSPISYFDRGIGQSAPAMTAAESVALAGKMWLYEDDTRTSVSEPDAGFDRAKSVEETCAQLRRNTAQCALRNFATWWMDLGMSGWFNHPQYWQEMKRLEALDQAMLKTPRPFRPEVAAVIDESSMTRVSFGGQVVTVPGVYSVRQPLGRMGAPYGQYLLDDVTAGRVSARMYVLLTAWSLSPDQRRQLLDTTRGSLRIWCYAPGYLEPHGTSLEAMQQLTGFRTRLLASTKAWAEPTPTGKALGLSAPVGTQEPIRPLFAAADATPDETLATYPDGSAAVALRKTSDGWSLFVGPPGLTSELLRLAARKAGVHLFTQTDCNVYANGPYLVLHTCQPGPLEINTGRVAPVCDLLSGVTLGQGPALTLPVRQHETYVVEMDKR